MMMRAELANRDHPERGVVLVSFPIPNEEYDYAIHFLERIGIGDVLEQDCQVVTLESHCPVLQRLEQQSVNLDELDYLARRMYCFSEETAIGPFQAMARRLDITDIRDFINLTFCFQQAGAIPDVSQLEQRYDGRCFPILYEPSVMALAVDTDQEAAGCLCLPASQRQIQRTLLRAGVQSADSGRLRVILDELSEEVAGALDLEHLTLEDLPALNRLCQALDPLRDAEQEKLNGVVRLAQPTGAGEVCYLAENLAMFDFGTLPLEELMQRNLAEQPQQERGPQMGV